MPCLGDFAGQRSPRRANGTGAMTAGVSNRELTRPNQAVIVAGGRGTRMLPYTETRPKTMIEFHGKPFLEYVLEMLREQGFNRFLMLLGYLPEVIQNHFGDGRHWGVEIKYSISEAETLTSRR